MEKLRKRYRAEKQRASAYPGRFFSSWALFHLLDEIESDPDQKVHNGVQSGCGFPLKGRNLVNVKLFDKKFGNVDWNSSPDFDFNGNGGSEFDVGTEMCQNSMAGFKFNSKLGENSSFYSEVDDYFVQRVDDASGFPLRSLGGRNTLPPGFRPKNNGKTVMNLKHNFKQDGDYGIDIRSDREFVSADFWPKSSGIVDGKRKVNLKEFDGYSSLSRSKFLKMNGVVGFKREVDPVEDLASSVTLLGERFVRMEKMKMEMTMEIEKMRMEMELKRNEVIIESQQQIVDAFVNALLEKKKKKKVKVESPDS